MLLICLAEPAEMDEFCQIQYRAVRNYKNQQQKEQHQNNMEARQ